jgi:hypothetical protein
MQCERTNILSRLSGAVGRRFFLNGAYGWEMVWTALSDWARQIEENPVTNASAPRNCAKGRAGDQLGFVEAINGLDERIVEAVADAAGRGLDACPSKPLGYSIKGYCTPRSLWWTRPPPRIGSWLGLLQRVEHEAGVSCAGDTPPDDAPRQGIDEEGDVNEAGRGGDVGEVGMPIEPWARCRDRRINAIKRVPPPHC